MKVNPVAVIISDIHFNVSTLPLASAALKAAISEAEELEIPVIIAGDLHDTKAIIRGEVANALLEIIQGAKTKIYILVGNHDLLNEKGLEHGLNYLRPYAEVIDEATHFTNDIVMIPYQSLAANFYAISRSFFSSKIIICHQGFKGAFMGDYIQDKTSVDPELVKDFKVISGHYHRHQTIGTVTYVGSPYTMSFGEANDGPKGFIILNSDGSYTREILNLRKHIILDLRVEDLELYEYIYPDFQDLVWVKFTGPKSELAKLNKNDLGQRIIGHSNFKLDLIPDEPNMVTNSPKESSKTVTNSELLDIIIDNSAETEEQRKYLKGLFREIIEVGNK